MVDDGEHRPEELPGPPSSAKGTAPRRVVGWIMIAAGVAVLSGSVWVGWRSYQAFSHLRQASSQVEVLQGQLTSIATEGSAATAETLTRLQNESAAARSAVDDPVYRAASSIPLVGPNLAAVSQVSATVDSLATDVLPSLVEVARSLHPAELRPTDGAIDLAPVQRMSPILENARTSLAQAQQRMAGIDRTSVVQQVADAVGAVQQKLGQAEDVIDPAARIARLLPPMLGADGPRTYLVAFQNLAEPRATGGIFGSFAIVRADHGRVTILDQGSARSMGFFDPPVAEVPESQRAVYSELMAQYPADVNFTPDFPTAARLFMQMYRLRTGTTVDGMLAIDPVALSYLMRGAPPIDVGGGVEITSDNVVGVLLSTVYQEYDQADQSPRDAFLANATAVVFNTVMSGGGDPASMLEGLRRSVAERRLLVFSANQAEQLDIAQTSLSGALDEQSSASSVGVFFNDGTAAKLGYYLSAEAHVTAGGCEADGRPELIVRVVMHYAPPASGLPAYVTGSTELGKAYVLRTNVLAFSPVGGNILGATRDGEIVGAAIGADHSRAVGTVTVELTPGSSTEVVFTVLGAPGAAGNGIEIAPPLILTPGITPWVTSVDPYRMCARSAR